MIMGNIGNMGLFFLALVFGLLAAAPRPCHAQEENDALRAFSVTCDSTDLERMTAQFWLDISIPATCTVMEKSYPCRLSLRGRSTRELPKKSWEIRFPDTNNALGAERVNLNAEYLDSTMLRNHLSMRLYSFLGIPAPRTDFARLSVNGQDLGVFLQVEEVDEVFFARRGRGVASLYKCPVYMNGMAPLVFSADYRTVWEQHMGREHENSELETLFSSIAYLDNASFASRIPGMMDVENVLRYFAAAVFLESYDCFAKNMYLFRDRQTGVYSLVPWDNDATFGNDYRGKPSEISTRFFFGHALMNQLLFQRLMEHEHWQQRFMLRLRHVQQAGILFLNEEIDATVRRIREAVRQDTLRICDGEEFEGKVATLRDWIDARTTFLDTVEGYRRPPLQSVFCSNAWPDADEPDVRFEVTLPGVSRAWVHLADHVDFSGPADSVAHHRVEFFDDGRHGDGAAGDGRFAGTVSTAAFSDGVIPWTILTQRYEYPGNGLLSLSAAPTHTRALVKREQGNDGIHDIRFGRVTRGGEEQFIELVNTGGDTVDLSWCRIRMGAASHVFLIPPGSMVAPRSILIVCGDTLAAELHYPGRQLAGNMAFTCGIGDSLWLLSPVHAPLLSTVCSDITELTVSYPRIIINEINYHPHENLDAGDWVELYNTSDTAVDLTGCSIRDADPAHAWFFPDNTLLPAKDFLVVYDDSAAFHAQHSDVAHSYGELKFGFSAAGDAVRLHASDGAVIDSVRYDDDAPWPLRADGHGATLALRDPHTDNSDPGSWSASQPGGTPGRANTWSAPAVVISEINYHSSDDHDAGDWIELYNPATRSVDLSNWYVTDSDDDHRYYFALNTTLAAGARLVLYEDSAAFHRHYPDVMHSSGPLGFGLNGEADVVRLRAWNDELVDSVAYRDDVPWLFDCDGFGSSMELMDPAADNAGAAAWQTSVAHGTPGRANSEGVRWPHSHIPAFHVFHPYPNPADGSVTLDLTLREEAAVHVRLHDAAGSVVLSRVIPDLDAGRHLISIDTHALTQGLYFCSVRAPGGDAELFRLLIFR